MLVPIPVGFVSSTVASVGDTMTGLWPVVIFIAAIPIGFYVLRLVRGLASVRAGRK